MKKIGQMEWPCIERVWPCAKWEPDETRMFQWNIDHDGLIYTELWKGAMDWQRQFFGRMKKIQMTSPALPCKFPTQHRKVVREGQGKEGQNIFPISLNYTMCHGTCLNGAGKLTRRAIFAEPHFMAKNKTTWKKNVISPKLSVLAPLPPSQVRESWRRCVLSVPGFSRSCSNSKPNNDSLFKIVPDSTRTNTFFNDTS